MDITNEMLNDATLNEEEGEGADITIKSRGDADQGNNNNNNNKRPIQQTLGIIKPDAIDKSDEIINVLRREGLAILQVLY